MTDAIPFQNRLSKNIRHLRKWARRRDIDCFRIYDRDIPEFPLAIDWYQGWVHAQIFSHHDSAAPEFDNHLGQAICEGLDCPPDQLVIKSRQRQKGRAQYEKLARRGDELVVQEGGLSFLINLHSYLDTGLFLDHRQTRAMVREMADGRRFLNLFAYTGSFSVYAADGGADASLTVDLSKTYQTWTQRNFDLNGISNRHHRLLQADVFSYLHQAVQDGERFDLIVMDPPSFSNSKRMQGVLDVQRDHRRLIDGCLQLLTVEGVLIFSTNLRRFKLDPALATEAGTEELTRHTVPEDFRRHRPHRCWRIAPG